MRKRTLPLVWCISSAWASINTNCEIHLTSKYIVDKAIATRVKVLKNWKNIIRIKKNKMLPHNLYCPPKFQHFVIRRTHNPAKLSVAMKLECHSMLSKYICCKFLEIWAHSVASWWHNSTRSFDAYFSYLTIVLALITQIKLVGLVVFWPISFN